jgi:hypothetical protein
LARSHHPDATWGELVAALGETTDRVKLVGAAHSNYFGQGSVVAGDYLTRLTTPRAVNEEYRMNPLIVADELGSSRVYQCQAPQAGATAFYELNKGDALRYTISEETKYQLALSGWSNRFLGYLCVGLPGDSATMVRTINAAEEFANSNIKNSL